MTNSQHIFIHGFEAGRHGAIIDVLAHINDSKLRAEAELEKTRRISGPNGGLNKQLTLNSNIAAYGDLIGELREMLNENPEVVGVYRFDRIFDKLENFLRNRALTPYRCYVEASVLQGFFDQYLGPGLSVNGADALTYRGVIVRAADYFNSRDTSDCVMVLTGLTNDDRIYSVRYNTDHTMTSELK